MNASQNCCDGKKAVCKPDSNGVYRCFGGCPNDDCTNCPTGYDANNPACCIKPGTGTANVCQFSDQCCGGAPCVPDVNGVLHCTAVVTCTPKDGACTGETDPSCCAPNTCQYDSGSSSYKCGLDTTSCTASGGTCASDPACCSQLCRDLGTGLKCVACVPNAATCTANGQCCSGTCDTGTGKCVAACQPGGGACTADTDCCSGAVCNIPPGTTSGTCGSVQTCAPDTAACNDSTPCCTGTCYTTEWALCTGLVSGCFCGE